MNVGRRICFSLTFLLGAMLTVMSNNASLADNSAVAKTILVFDASGSMHGKTKGRPKISIAREVIADLVGNIDPNVHLGLTVYGHRRKGDCGDIQNLIPPGPVNRSRFIATVNAIQPKGRTPLSDAVRLAAESLNYTEDPATVILVSDGVETCAADPCAVGKALKQAGAKFLLHVVGFGLKPDETKALQCMAEATGGQYFNADNAASLSSALGQAVKSAAANIRRNFLIYPVLGPGGPRVQPGMYWSLKQIEGQSDKPHFEIRNQLKHHLAEQLPNGKFTVNGKASFVSGTVEILIDKSSPAEFYLPLNAGAVNFSIYEATDRPFKNLAELKKSIYPLDVAGAPLKDKRMSLESINWNPVLLPPGRYRFTASAGYAEAFRDIELALGQMIKLDLLVESGVLTIGLVAKHGAPLKANGNVWVSVHPLDDKGVPAAKNIIGAGLYNGELGARPSFRLSPGRYRVSSKLGEVTGSKDVEIVAGEQKNFSLEMASGH